MKRGQIKQIQLRFEPDTLSVLIVEVGNVKRSTKVIHVLKLTSSIEQS